MEALVSDEDFETLSKHAWYANPCWQKTGPAKISPRKEKWYARNSECGYMHRYLMQPPKHMVVHHIDDNGLNNQRENLRVITQIENIMNHRFKKPTEYDDEVPF